MNVFAFFKDWIDKILVPPIKFLKMARDKLDAANMVIAQGLDVGSYLKVFGDLPGSWQAVITSALLATVFLGVLLTFRSIMRIYYALKEGVKWW